MIVLRSVRHIASALGILVALLAAPGPGGSLLAEGSGDRIVFVDRDSTNGLLIGIDAEWNLTFQIGDKATVVPASDVAYWGRYRDVETGPQVLLRDGSILRADVLDLNADTVAIGDATGLGRCLWEDTSLPRGAVSGVLLQPPADALARDKLIDRIQTYKLREDQLLLTGGESVSGKLMSSPRSGRFLQADEMPADVYRLSRKGTEATLDVPVGKVVAILLGGVSAAPNQSEKGVQLGFRDGSLIQARQIATAGDAIRFNLQGEGFVSAPIDQPDEEASTIWRQIAWVQPTSSRLQYLSDLKPLGYKHIPLLALDWPYGENRNVLGGRLRSGQSIYSKGVGMHTVSRLAYDLEGKYRHFMADVALDDAAGLQGSVAFKVLVERAPNKWDSAYESPVVHGGDPPLPISVNLTGARRIALIVDYADRADEQDHANWLMARLIE